MGFGDVRLAALLGLFLGWLGLGHVLVGLFLAFLLASVVGVALIVDEATHPQGSGSLRPVPGRRRLFSRPVRVTLCCVGTTDGDTGVAGGESCSGRGSC